MVKEMCKDKTVLIYTAGIIDGEGYISVLKKSNRSKKYRRVPFYADAVVKVASVDRILTDFLYEKFGGYLHERKAKKEYHRNSWAWEMKGSLRVYEFLQSIYPYLLIKRPIAKTVLDFIKLRKRIGRVGNHRGCDPTTQADWDEMEKYIILARSYTARGHDSHRNSTSPATTE